MKQQYLQAPAHNPKLTFLCPLPPISSQHALLSVIPSPPDFPATGSTQFTGSDTLKPSSLPAPGHHSFNVPRLYHLEKKILLPFKPTICSSILPFLTAKLLEPSPPSSRPTPLTLVAFPTPPVQLPGSSHQRTSTVLAAKLNEPISDHASPGRLAHLPLLPATTHSPGLPSVWLANLHALPNITAFQAVSLQPMSGNQLRAGSLNPGMSDIGAALCFINCLAASLPLLTIYPS